MDPLLTAHAREPNSFTLDFYLAHEGYEGLKKNVETVRLLREAVGEERLGHLLVSGGGGRKAETRYPTPVGSTLE